MDLDEVLIDVREMVECESPSADLAAVAESAEVVARVGARRLGVEPERVVIDGRTHLRWRLGTGRSRVLVLGHHDGRFIQGPGLFAFARRGCGSDREILHLELAADISRAAGPRNEAWVAALRAGMDELLVHLAGAAAKAGELEPGDLAQVDPDGGWVVITEYPEADGDDVYLEYTDRFTGEPATCTW